MRQLADADRICGFMRALGREARADAWLYFTGGATAVLMGWRASTIDVDILVEPESDPLLRALPSLKDTLEINIELACPSDFIPELPGWRDRAMFITREGRVSFYHYDPYAQALAKIERGHAEDLQDVHEMVRRGLVDPVRALEYFHEIEPHLYRYPAIHPASFRKAAAEIFETTRG
jgi:hypothetical protein